MAPVLEEQLLLQTAEIAFQLVWQGIKGLGSCVVDKNAVQRGMREYARKFLERHGNIKILNMDQPIPLREIYVAAQVISPRSMRSFSSVDELHELFLKGGQHRLTSGERQGRQRDCLELANEVQLLNVLGAPGAGKTTFLRLLGLEALLPRIWSDSFRNSMGLRAGLESCDRSRYAHDCLPVLIELRRFRTEEIDLVQLIRNELETCGLPESGQLAKALLERGRLLVLLDGVDEVPSGRIEQAITHIHDFVDRYSCNRFVISCRTAFYKGYFSRFRDVLLSDFDDHQIATFVRNWFRSDEDRRHGIADEFVKLLSEPSNASAKELASTPLLLTFLCLTYDDRQRLPANRSELYRQALEILMERWASSKRVHNEPIYRELHTRLEVQMLAEIAAPAFRDNRYFFTRRELTDRITAFLHEELNAPKHLDGDQVLDAIEVQQGLIVQRAQDAWSFSHLTLQEYLTAVWYENNQRLGELVTGHLVDVHWREVFILLAGALTKADELLKQMQGTAEKRLAGATRFQRWAGTRAVSIHDAQQAAGQRAFALALAMDLDRAFSIDRALMGEFDVELDLDFAVCIILERAQFRAQEIDLARDLADALGFHQAHAREFDLDFGFAWSCTRTHARDFFAEYAEQLLASLEALDSAQILPGVWEVESQVHAVRAQLRHDASFGGALKAWRRVLDIFVHTLQLPAELRDSIQHRDALEAYLRACQWIVDCKNAATRVSRSAWDDICRRMLNPPELAPPGDMQAREASNERHA
jgi:hypothetical protein